MLTLLSPAKKLLHFDKPYLEQCTTPRFEERSQSLMEILKSKSERDIAKLMNLSPSLSKLNYERNHAFDLSKAPLEASYPALYFFQGDVYQTLQPFDWSNEVVRFSQSHLLILSGLYGLLRPLDRIQAYRLEMGTRLRNPAGTTLYEFWQETITQALNNDLERHEVPVIINLASTEYFKAVNSKMLKFPIIQIQFLEEKNNQQKIIGIYAKKARGLMARFIMSNGIDHPEKLKSFDALGYQFDPEQSDKKRFLFVRRH